MSDTSILTEIEPDEDLANYRAERTRANRNITLLGETLQSVARGLEELQTLQGELEARMESVHHYVNRDQIAGLRKDLEVRIRAEGELRLEKQKARLEERVARAAYEERGRAHRRGQIRAAVVDLPLLPALEMHPDLPPDLVSWFMQYEGKRSKLNALFGSR